MIDSGLKLLLYGTRIRINYSSPGNIWKFDFYIFSYPGNIGNRVFLIAWYPGHIGNWIFLVFWYPGNIGDWIFLVFWSPGNIGDCMFLIQSYPGNIGNLIFPIVPYPGNIETLFFLYFLNVFSKKARAEFSRRMVRFSRRDLSYETDSGPKTKTVSDLNFQVTPTATAAAARRQLSHLARALDHHAQGPNIPFGVIPHFDIQDSK